MNVEANKVVSFHYTVNDGGAEPVDSSRERGEPLTVLIGHGNIIPGLEKALLGRAVGDHFQISVAPAEAYGERRANFTQRVPKKYFDDAEHLQPGMSTVLNTREAGPRMVVVHKIGSSVIDVDLNHPLAGKTLAFDVEITDIRDASEEEIAHRHAHGAGGHEH
ncbi:peptidylprolyl isomerase [Dokdonella sp.]|uniref:FKBP-type peptidyl-prolyl cis-trans isomerase n=1 Tax=Dokdonella sp. TaxID=2291710 RepID=UPI0037839DFE